MQQKYYNYKNKIAASRRNPAVFTSEPDKKIKLRFRSLHKRRVIFTLYEQQTTPDDRSGNDEC
jgi:hypothetical protein